MKIRLSRIAQHSFGTTLTKWLDNSTDKQIAWAQSVGQMSSDARLRRALQCARYRGFFRKLTHPMLLDVPERVRARSEEVAAWAAERGVIGMHGDIPFDCRNFGKARHQILFTDVIDFREPQHAMEFKMVWL